MRARVSATAQLRYHEPMKRRQVRLARFVMIMRLPAKIATSESHKSTSGLNEERVALLALSAARDAGDWGLLLPGSLG